MLLNIAPFETAPSYISTTIPKTLTRFPAFRTRFWKFWVRWFNDFSCTAYVYSNSCFEANLQFLERDTDTQCVWSHRSFVFREKLLDGTRCRAAGDVPVISFCFEYALWRDTQNSCFTVWPLGTNSIAPNLDSCRN